MAIWITSDLHFCHDKGFIYEPRGFKCIEDMNKQIIKNWNNIIGWDDEVYCLGDGMLNNDAEGLSYIKSLHGNIHWILGNHDTTTRRALYEDCYNVIDVEYAAPLHYNGYRFYMTHYPTLCTNGDNRKPLKKQVINLCGHTHTFDKFADMDKGLIYHCELEAHNGYPVLLDQVIKDVEKYTAGRFQ